MTAQVLWLGSHVVVLSICWLQTAKEGLYGSRVQHATRVAAVTSQLCFAVVSCGWAVVILVKLLGTSTRMQQ